MTKKHRIVWQHILPRVTIEDQGREGEHHPRATFSSIKKVKSYCFLPKKPLNSYTRCWP